MSSYEPLCSNVDFFLFDEDIENPPDFLALALLFAVWIKPAAPVPAIALGDAVTYCYYYEYRSITGCELFLV